ncbi:MAG: DUF4097 family beta strand repeat protein [Phycisphaerales bacterium]|nr:DUF4097 family beta strand repeat protein [Phycisphaerales bacterium]
MARMIGTTADRGGGVRWGAARRALAMAGIGFGVLSGCATMNGCVLGQANERESRASTTAHQTGTALDVSTRNGKVIIAKADVSEVSVVAELRMQTKDRLADVTVVTSRGPDGVLVVKAEPPEGGWKNSEGCGFTITVPDAAGVKVRTGNGEVRLQDLDGPADLQTSNGKITVLGHRGDVTADTSNGAIEIEGASGRVEADTSNGKIAIRLADESTGPVIAESSNGAITVEVGQAFRGRLSARTSNGGIDLPSGSESMGGTPLRVVSRSKSEATVEVGAAETAASGAKPAPPPRESRIRTSNGHVTVKVR